MCVALPSSTHGKVILLWGSDLGDMPRHQQPWHLSHLHIGLNGSVKQSPVDWCFFGEGKQQVSSAGREEINMGVGGFEQKLLGNPCREWHDLQQGRLIKNSGGRN